MNIMRLFSLLPLIFIVACKSNPTKVTEGAPSAWATRLQETTKKPLKLSNETVVLDSRSEFDYGLAHWSSSVRFTWEQLVQDARKPWLMLDKLTAQKRLALMGIQPNTPVVVIGYGHKGKGDEGRLAWSLVYYGINNVQTVSVDGMDVYFTHDETPQRPNTAVWDAPVRENLAMDRGEFIQVATSPRKTATHTNYIVDVRSKDEYFNKTTVDYETPDLHALQIDWHEFYGGDGRPAKAIRSKLHSVGVKAEDEIVLISSDSIRSSAAAYALIALGFKDVKNFLNGWDSLVKQKK